MMSKHRKSVRKPLFFYIGPLLQRKLYLCKRFIKLGTNCWSFFLSMQLHVVQKEI